MSIEKKYVIVVVLAAVMAIPVTLALQHRTHQLKIEKSQNTRLQLQVNDAYKKLQLKDSQIKQNNLDKIDEQKKVDQLQTQLQSKREQQATIAAAPAHPAPVAVSAYGGCASYRGLVAQYNWNVDVAMAIMQAESGCRAVTPNNAYMNYDGVADYGLFQLHGINVTDPAENVRIAYTVKYLGAKSSFTPWSTYNSGAYLRYL